MRGGIAFVLQALAICICIGLSAQEKPDACETVRAILADASALHPGMTRADLEKEFKPSSLTFRSAATYISKRCSYVAMDVAFDISNSLPGPELPDDKIKTISRPYLALPSAD